MAESHRSVADGNHRRLPACLAYLGGVACCLVGVRDVREVSTNSTQRTPSRARIRREIESICAG